MNDAQRKHYAATLGIPEADVSLETVVAALQKRADDAEAAKSDAQVAESRAKADLDLIKAERDRLKARVDALEAQAERGRVTQRRQEFADGLERHCERGALTSAQRDAYLAKYDEKDADAKADYAVMVTDFVDTLDDEAATPRQPRGTGSAEQVEDDISKGDLAKRFEARVEELASDNRPYEEALQAAAREMGVEAYEAYQNADPTTPAENWNK